MTSVCYLFRLELRRRGLAWFAAALLIGIAGTAVLGAFAGARRTASVITRSAGSSDAEDLSFGPDTEGTPPAWSQVDQLAAVAEVSTAHGLVALRLDHGRPDEDWLNSITAFPTDDRWLRTIGRPQMLAGRLPNPGRPEELFVNETMARREHLRVGQRLQLIVLTGPELEAARSPEDLPPGRRLEVVIVGIGRLRDEAIRDPSDPQLAPAAVFTAAASARFSELHPVNWDGKFVRLRHGSRDVASFERQVRALVPGVAVTFAERKSADARARRSMQPYVIALIAFGALAALASLAIISQMLGRQQAAQRSDRRVLHAMGFTGARFGILGAIEGAVIGATGAALAVGGAIAISPLTPIGPLRRLEPSPGTSVDPLVLGVGAAVIILLVLARLAMSGSRTPAPAGVARTNRVVDRVAQRLPVPVGSGLRLATDSGRGTRAIPLRSTMLGLCTALAAITATVVFSADLANFVATPRLYGWSWDALVAPDDGNRTLPATSAAVHSEPKIAHAAAGRFGQVASRGTTIAALGIDGPPNVAIVRGRGPTHDDEVALGITSLNALDASVGDHISMRGPGGARPFLVTGVAVFPRLAPYPAAEPTGLGIGAAFTRAGLARLVPDSQDSFMLVNLRGREPVTPAARHALQARVFDKVRSGQVLGPQRPNDVTSYDRLERTPLALAALLAVLALATAAHVLISSVRRRRADLAVLKTLGFTRRQVATTVAAQATTMIGLAVIIAMPLGVVLGRWCWSATARWLGIPEVHTIPYRSLLVITVAAVFLANLIAYIPGRIASRVRPALALRAE